MSVTYNTTSQEQKSQQKVKKKIRKKNGDDEMELVWKRTAEKGKVMKLPKEQQELC